MQERVTVTVSLHARPSAEFVKLASGFASDVFLEKDGKKINAKSIMGVLSFAIQKGTDVTLHANGSDGEEAIRVLKKYLTQ